MDDAKYTDPDLRKRLKDEIQAGDGGGKPGRWSARKAQLLVQEYEQAGGGYAGERDERQRHLEQWGEQDWHAQDRGADARGEHGTSRYLPDAAWKLLTKQERDATDARKRGGAEQFVANTDAAKEARAAAELLTLKAEEARRRVAKLDSTSALKRARKAEQKLGKARKTVLAAIEQRLAQL